MHLMPLDQAVAMGVLQGLAEFAPISSSAHLVLFPWLVKPWAVSRGWIADPGQAFDAALHIGTAAALILYFWREWRPLISAFILSVFRQASWENRNVRLAWLIVIATIPGAIFGKLLEKRLDALFDPDQHNWAPAAIAGVLIVMGIVLWLADHFGSQSREVVEMKTTDAVLIGLSQSLALFPGVSRSGATITAGRLLGLNREAAARFSFLMATPITLGAGLLKLAELRHSTEPHPQASALIAGVVTSGVVGYLVIAWFLDYLRRQNLTPFAIYRVIVGVAVLAVWFFRHGS